MPIYRVHFKNHGGKVFAVDEFECEHEHDAIRIAHQKHVPSIGYGFDVLRDGHPIYSHPSKDTER